MGRRVPIENLSLVHPIIYLSFLAAGLAASMAIITAICSFRFGRKPSEEPPCDSLQIAKEIDAPTPTSPTIAQQETTTENDTNEVPIKEPLPLPPALQQPKDSFPSNNMKRVTSERRGPSLSLSMKMPRSLSVAKNWDHMKDHIKDQIKEDKHKLKPEDSVWMKTIILGEKCNPDEEDDPVIYEGKGKKIAAYHTKRYSNTVNSVSGQDSFNNDHDALSSLPLPPQQQQTQDQKQSTALNLAN